LSVDRTARHVAVASILVSASLAALKITVGLKANSTAVVSDGLESAGDVLSSGLVLFGLEMAAKPPDREHPYGHGRLETLTALVVGMMLIVTGVLISIRSMQRAFEVQHAPAAFAIWALVVSIGVKGVLGLAKRRVGRRIGSASLTADSWNDAMDMFSGAAALVAVSLSVFDPVRFVWADHLGGAAVGLIVIFVGGRVAHDTTLQLMDTMPDPRRMREIRETALGVPGALAVEKCFARKTGLKYHVDMHLEVDPGMTVYESHEIATRVRDRIREKLDWVADVLVHVEPHMLATVSGKPHGKP